MLHLIYGIFVTNTNIGRYWWTNSSFFFVLQLLICILVRRKTWPKLLPVFFILSEWIGVAIIYLYEFGHKPTGSSGGAMVFQYGGSMISASLVALSTFAIVCAWILYGVVCLESASVAAVSVRKQTKVQTYKLIRETHKETHIDYLK